MKLKFIVIALIGAMVFSNSCSTSLAMNVNNSNPVDYWALVICVFDEITDYNQHYYLKEILCHHGWEADHIRLLFGSQTTKQDVIDAISWLDEHEDSNDIVLILIDSHGGDFGFWLNGGEMRYEELNNETDKLESAGILIAVGSCFGGVAIPYLEKRGRVIITACAANETYVGFRDGYFNLALAGLGDMVGNNDGVVSAEEVYTYVKMNSGAHPQISDRFLGNLNLVSLSANDRCFDQKQLRSQGGGTSMGVGGPLWRAQSFIPSSRNLTKIQLCVEKNIGSNNYSIRVAIKHDLLGEELTSISLNGSQIRDSVSYLTDFDFPDVEVIPGETYYIICNASEAFLLSPYSLKSVKTDLYPYGEVYTSSDAGKTWVQDGTFKDLLFITYDNRTVLNIEEVFGSFKHGLLPITKLGVTLKNSGDKTIYNVDLNINARGGYCNSVSMNYTWFNCTIELGEERFFIIGDKQLRGFGPFSVTVSVTSSNVVYGIKNVKGFQLFLITFVDSN